MVIAKNPVAKISSNVPAKASTRPSPRKKPFIIEKVPKCDFCGLKKLMPQFPWIFNNFTTEESELHAQNGNQLLTGASMTEQCEQF